MSDTSESIEGRLPRDDAVHAHEVVELARLLAGAGSLRDIALLAAGGLRALAAAEDCDVWLLDEGFLRCLASVDSRGSDESLCDLVLELAEHPATAQALSEREMLVCTSLDDPRIAEQERADLAAYGYRSMMSIPLVSGDDTVGLIDIYDTAERDYEEVRRLMTDAAGSVADALANAHLVANLRRGNASLRELVDLGDRLNEARDPRDVAQAAASSLRQIIDTAACEIWTIDGDRVRRQATVRRDGVDTVITGEERSLADVRATRGTLADNEPLVIDDLAASHLPAADRAAHARSGHKSLVSLPMTVEGCQIGFLDVLDTRVRDFADHLDFVRTVRRLLAGSLERTLLVDRLESGNRDLSFLLQSSLDFSATLDVAVALDTAAGRMLHVSGADACDIYRLHGDELVSLVSVGTLSSGPAGESYAVADFTSFVRAAETHAPVVRLDVLADPETTDAERLDAARRGYRATLDVPLVSQGALTGFVSLFNRDARPFAHEDVVVGLARIAAQALANASLYRELEENLQRSSLLNRSALELGSSLDLRGTLLAAGMRLCESVAVTECEITVMEGDGVRTLMRVADGTIDEEWIGQYLSLADAAITLQVIETKRPVVVPSLRDPRLSPKVQEINRDHDLKSWVTLPLIVKDRVIGTVELVASGLERTFSQSELDTAAAICQPAALAIENAALFEREQAAAEQTLLINEIAMRTAASLDLRKIVEAAAVELRKLMAFDGHSLLLAVDGRIQSIISTSARAAGFVGLTEGELGKEFVRRLEEDRVIVLRLPEDVPFPPGHPAIEGLGSVVAIALCTDGRLTGAFNLESSDPDAFTDVDTGFLERVATQLSLAIKNARLYDEVKQMHRGNLEALSTALNAKDYYTLGHATRVAAYTVMLGRHLGWPPDLLDAVEEAAYLHDIGKIGVSDRVLLKAGRLNEREWEQMRLHPVLSADIIRPLFSDDLVLGVRHHHERYDGSGYPDGLTGGAIPPLARAMAVADAYDAMSCRRPYRAALNYPECRAELERCRGTQFEPAVTDAFLAVLDELAERKTWAESVAESAAARISGEQHRALRGPKDEDTPAFAEIRAELREVRDAHPPTRFLTTQAAIGGMFVICVDAEEIEDLRSPFGEEIIDDEELRLVLDGTRPDTNALFADEYGVWVTGLAPIRDAAGRIVAAVAADLPALGDVDAEGAGRDRPQTFAAKLQTTAVRLSRAEIDATTDALTGLYSHRHLQDCLREILQHSRDPEQRSSVLFFDLDDFKGFNTVEGHSAGDAVLRDVAHLIEQSVRKDDIVGRYGGEEFLALLPRADRDAALEVAERILDRMRGAGFGVDGSPLTASIGVATYPDDADERDGLLARAEEALGLAKQRGRDQVATFADD